MPNLAKLQIAFKNIYVRIGTGVLVAALVWLFMFRGDVAQDTTPLIHSQNIAEITSLAARKDQLDYLLVARPLSESPRYVFKFKNESALHVVKVPSTSHFALEREVLLKNAIPYSIAKEDFLASHKAVLLDEGENGTAAEVTGFLKRHMLDILLIGLIIYALKFGIPGMGMNASVISPDKLKGSMDDLIGMEDIKQEVLHLEDMIRNRAEYKSHNIDKPFNVMLTGPAGTGKTKLVGYLAKKLGVPLIQASGSALESGFVGGGSKALNALYRKACAHGNCMIFLDEAQTLFMPRGRGEKKWEDDTATTLLGLLDGVKSDKGAGVIWVVAVNFENTSSEMDEAMLRRFSVKINFRLPNKNERSELLKNFLSRKKDGLVDWNDLDHGFQQGRAEVGRHFGDLAQVEVVPVDQAVLFAGQEIFQQLAALILIGQAEIDLDGEAAQHGFVHFRRGIVEVGGDHPDDAGALVALDAIEQAQQGVGGVVFPFLFTAAAGHEQGLGFVQENHAIAVGAGLAIQGVQGFRAAAHETRFQRRAGGLDQGHAQLLGQIPHQLGFTCAGRARQHDVEGLVDIVRFVLGAVADHVFQVQHFLLDVFHADQVVHAALELVGRDDGGVHAHAGNAEFQGVDDQADQQDVEHVALQEARHFGRGAVFAFIEQHGFVGGEEIFLGDGIGDGVLQQHFALQRKVGGAGHLDDVQRRFVLELEDVAGRFRQGPRHQ